MKNYLHLIRNAVISLISEEKKQRAQFTGILGNHAGVTDAGDGLVYMTLFNGQVIRLINRRVPNVPYKSVVAGYEPSAPNVLQVLYSREVYGGEDADPDVPNHHETHEYPSLDTVWVGAEQFTPLLTLPSSGFIVQVYGGVLRKADDSGWMVVQSEEVDLSSYQPSAGAKYVLIDVDDSGVLSVISGSLVDSIDELSVSDIPETSNIPIACVRLYDGQDEIRRGDPITDFLEVRALVASNVGADHSDNFNSVQRSWFL